MTKRMQQAIELANNWESFFLTWEAWSGKSTLVKYILQNINKKNVVQVAPTWIAAINIWWATIHNVFGISPNQTPWVWRKLDDKKTWVLEVLDMLIVDEVSMVRIDLIESMDKTLQYVRKNNFFMWWVQTIFVWDLLQLPPIIDDKLFHMLKERKWYQSWYIFDYQWWKDANIKTVILDKIFRQSDTQYIAALNQIRKWEQTQWTLNFLNEKCYWRNYDDKSIVLTPTNKLADMYNMRAINRLKSMDWVDYYQYKAEQHWFNEKEYPAPYLLRLVTWWRVMIVVNDPHWTYVNWTMWTFVQPTEEWLLEIKKDNWETIFLEKYEWPKHVPVKTEDDEIDFAKVWQYSQYPIKYWWAITQHKSQWCTFESVYIDLGPRTFATGQLYVALSRCKTLEWMTFSKPLEQRHVLTDKYVLWYLKKYD